MRYDRSNDLLTSLEHDDGGRVCTVVSWIVERELARFVVVFLGTCASMLLFSRIFEVMFSSVVGDQC